MTSGIAMRDKERATLSVRIYAETLDALKDEQYRMRKAGLAEPTYAELIEKAADACFSKECRNTLNQQLLEVLVRTYSGHGEFIRSIPAAYMPLVMDIIKALASR